MSIKLIKDTILQNIIFSKFEGLLFSNQLINRLHFITQNSMAYRVFPADRTSRFLHSTGVMYLSSEIFKNGLSNADHYVLKEFIEEKRELVNEIINENIDKLPDMYPITIQNETEESEHSALYLLGEKLNDILGESFINHFVFFNDVFCDKENYATYLILLIGIRAMGLLHDIGHLPYSHISEFALEEDVLNDLEIKKEKGKELSKQESEIVSLIKSFIDEHGDKIHETVGKKLIELFFADIEEQIKHGPAKTHVSWILLFVKVIKCLLLMIKEGETGRLYSMYSIVASDFDADRLDFVMRDGLASGLIDKTGDVDRILKMYCLCINPEEKMKDRFIFLPSVQCLNDVQQILIDRYRIYKFLVNHHKVKKMDYILQKAIALLMEIECKSDSMQKTKAALDFKYISDMVRVSSDVLKTQLNPDNVKRTKYQFAQLTENWAYSILNRKYIDLLINNHAGDQDLSTLKLLLDEIFTGENIFESLWKREHEFCDFISELNEKIITSEESKKAITDKIESIKDTNKGQLILKDTPMVDENIGKLAIRYLNVCCSGWQKDIERLFSGKKIIVLIRAIKTKVGISNLSLVDLKNPNNTYEFKKVSKVYDYLCLDNDGSTKFYVYYSKVGHNNVLHDLDRNDISNMLIEFIIGYIRK